MTPRELAAIVQETYLRRFDELTPEFQRHFASRLYMWQGNEDAARRLAAMRGTFAPETHETRVASLRAIADEWAAVDLSKEINNWEVRKPFFDAYPQLFFLHLMLFRIRHWHCLYGIDGREALYEVIPKAEVLALLRALREDQPAILALSTYAVNTFYLYEKLYPANVENHFVDVPQLFDLKNNYDYANKKDLQLLMYLYTHCILGETLFYYQPIARHEEIYRAMLQEIEHIIAASYADITLDNKFEFLVCARLCGFQSSLAKRIYDEALQSVHPEHFLVDKLNTYVHPFKQSFVTSEHRNVLFIMSTSEPLYNQRPMPPANPNTV